MTDNNSGLNTIGNYNAKIYSSKVSTVISDTLPIYQGIKIYPLRYGIYKYKHNEDELSHIEISNIAEGEYSLIDVSPKPMKGNSYTTLYPNLRTDELYSYFSMPLRDGWLYMISKNKKGIYEYKHLNFRYKLYTFYKPEKTEIFPTNTTWESFVQCGDNDKVYLFYSEVRLEEYFLRSRFFKDNNLRHPYGFDVARWLSKKDQKYKTDRNNRRMAAKDVNVSIINDSFEQVADFKKVMENVVNDLNKKNKSQKKDSENIERQDVFFIIDDPVGLGKQIAQDIEYWHVEHEMLLRSLQTGIPKHKILECINNTNYDEDSLFGTLSNKEIFPENKNVFEAEYMHSMAIILKTFFLDFKNPPKELEDYIEEGRKKLDPDKINTILGVDLRKNICNEIDKYRGVLITLVRSAIFEYYCLLFLDKKENGGNVSHEENLSYIIPESYEYDFNEAGATYNYMVSQIRDILEEFITTLALSPTQKEMYLGVQNNDWYADAVKELKGFIKKTENGEGDENKKSKYAITRILQKEVIPQEYFEKKHTTKALAFYEQSAFNGWSFAYMIASQISTAAPLLLSTRFSVPIEWKLQWIDKGGSSFIGQSEGYTIASRNYAEKGVKYSIVIENDGTLFVRTVDPNGTIQTQHATFNKATGLRVEKTSKGANLRIEKAAQGPSYKVSADGTLTMELELLPKANWNAVKNPAGLAKYIALKSAEISVKIMSSKVFAPVMPMLCFYMIKNSLQDPDRSIARKTNDVTMNVAMLAAISECFLPKSMTDIYIKNPARGLEFKGRTFSPRIHAKYLFRSFVVVANLCDGLDGILTGNELIEKGNTTTGELTRVFGFLLIAATFLLLIPGWGWAAYVIVTIVLALAKWATSFFVDTAHQLFLEATVFSKEFEYNFLYTGKGSMQEKMECVYWDIWKLTELNALMKRHKTKYYMESFRYQIDELTMIHLFAPSFHSCSFTPKRDAWYISPKQAGSTYIFSCPKKISIAITGDFSFFSSRIENIEMDVFLSYKRNPGRENLYQLSSFTELNEEILCINGVWQKQQATDKNFIIHQQGTGVIYREGMLQYYYSVEETDISKFDTKKSYTYLATYPFFEREKYYIFLYIRFRFAGGDWMPAPRYGEKQYLVYRYKLERIRKPSDYTMTPDDIAIKPAPQYKNLR